MNSETTNLFDRTSRWLQESVMIKLFSIGIMVLLLLIPTAWITSLMEERQRRADEVMQEVGDKWSGKQTLVGPVLMIPVEMEEKIDHGKEGVEIRKYVQKTFFLPEELKLDGEVNPQLLHRGLFDAVVFESKIRLNASFAPPDFSKLQVSSSQVRWSEARLLLGISDLRGITDQPVVQLGDQPVGTEPSGPLNLWSKSVRPAGDSYPETPDGRSDGGIIANPNWKSAEDFKGSMSMQLSMRGSERLYFVPVGKNTSVHLAGPWGDPSFEGEFLPVSRTVAPGHFEASWKVLHFNRSFAQEWMGPGAGMSGNDFGVKLLNPVDQYQKSIRSAKYGVLLIMLTFISLLMVEIVKKIRIHPFQYILIGVAITIYYTLLLSFSEHVGFNGAYGISSVATVTLITLYATTFLHDRKMTAMLASLLVFFYVFVFVIIQLQDFSLLVGSIGLFVIISLLMYFSRNIRWYER